MASFPKTLPTIICLLAAIVCSGIAAEAQGIALRSGELAELGDVYYVSRDCKSLLTAVPEVEIMEGPPGVTVTIRDAQVTPHAESCANPVRGGKVTISAGDIAKRSDSALVLRFKYKTRSGDRQSSRRYKLSLFPTAELADSVAVKSGETIELGDVYWVAKCRSTLIGLPTVEVMEGAPELSFAVKEAIVVPRKYGCVQAVEGGKLVLTAGTITEAKEAKVVYRVHYKLIDGEREIARTRKVLLFP
jgi:hypothetical protein